MKRISFLAIILLSLVTLSSCKIKTFSKEKYVQCFYNYHVQSEKNAVGIDLRDLETEYASGHIKGFVNYNYQKGSKEEFIIYVTSLYNKKTYIFLIDNNGEYVHSVAQILKEEGYKNIIVYDKGYNDIEEYAKETLQIVEGTDDCGC